MMGTSSRCSLVLIFIISEIIVLGLTTPVWNSQSSIGLGRNIRHLPCVSRRSGETGVCMFAISCAKANGTHLGTCIDRFYFGSCCKLALPPEDLTESIDSNHLYEEAPAPPSTEHYQLSTFQSVQTIQNTTLRPAVTSTTTARTTVEPTTAKPSKRPTTTSTPTSTVSSSTFTHKPVSTSKPSVTKPVTQTSSVRPKPTGKPPTRPQGTKPSTVPKPPSSTSSSKPSAKPPVKPPTKPSVKPPTKPVKPSNGTLSKPSPQKPSNGTNSSKPGKPIPTKRPSGSNTTKPSLSQQQKPQVSTSKPSKPTHRPAVKPSSTAKPVTKPPLKPVPLVTSIPTTDPNYVKVPVVTVPTVSSNVTPAAAGEVPIATTSSTLLVTWTTVDEVPQPPLPKPASTPSSQPAKNETVPSSTTSTSTAATTQSSQTWVQVSVSTPGPTTEHAKPVPTTAAPLSSSTLTTTAASNLTTSVTSGSTASTEAAATNLTTGAPTEATNVNVTEDASQNEIQHLNMTNYLDVCGRRLFPGARIVGGDKATFGKWPWQISLRQWRTSTYLHKCGAALLNENWAITAAHCVENVAPSDLLLRLGEHDLSLEDEPYGYQERRVQIVASHPQFDPRTFEYDLALLRFYEPVTFQPNIIPVCVPQDDTNFVGSTAYVTGWGRLYEDGPLPSVLQEVSVPVINNTVCETMYRAAGYIEHIPEIFICAGWKKGGFDSCEGDSGGPMVIQRPDKRWLLAGVISWGIGCAEPNQPGVYTRISEFRGWINQILQF